MARTKSTPSAQSTATIGFEAKLWLTAEQAGPAPHFAEAEYNGGRPQGLLGLILLKYISDTFEEHRAKLLAGSIRVPRVGSGVPADPLGQHARDNAEDPDEP